MSHDDNISKLKVSDVWKKRFHLVEKAGGTEMPFMRDLEFEEIVQLYGNPLAFLFGPFYYFSLGMRRQAVGFALCWLAIIFFCAKLHWWGGLSGLGGILAVAGSVRANVSYYAKLVLHADRWL